MIDGTVPLADLVRDVPPDLAYACGLANEVAYSVLGYRSTCVLTSHALAEFLRLRGREPELVRPEWHAFPKCRCATGACHGLACHGGSLSWDGDGTHRPASAPGFWKGHLAVACDGHLLDPTIDQLNNGYVNLPPLVVPMAGWWDEGLSVRFTDTEGTFVRGNKYRRQVGWKSAPDARRSHWDDVLREMIARSDRPLIVDNAVLERNGQR